MPWSPSIVGSGSGGKSPCEQRSSKQHHDPELTSTSRIEDIRLKLSSPSRDRDSFVSNSSSDRGGSVSPVGHDSDTPPDMPTSAPPQTTTKYVPLSERAGMLKNPNHTVVDDSHKDTASHMTTAKRDMRDAFFKNDVSAPPKFDPGQREREKDQEKEVRSRAAYTSHTHSSSKEVDGYVGFANLPNQVYRKSVKRGFEFTLMVVGESGLGKSTLVNSMFITDLYNADYMGPSHRIKKTVQVDTTQVLLKEGGVQLKLTVVDTPGFGDAVDNSNCWQPVINYVESKYEHYLNAESRVNRNITADERVHCCLYFIAPTGHGLKPLDIEFMKRLHDKVNIIPLIAKADTLTPDECREFKKTLLNEIARHKIKIYEFPDCDDEEENRHQKKLKDRVPFAVVGSNTVVEAGGRKVRGRIYPWGVVEVENLEHNDFIALRNMLIRTHMQDLKDITNNVHYENFRYSRLAFLSADDTHSKVIEKDPIGQMAEEKKDHVQKLKKMEAEMEQVFEMKVKEKMQKLKDSEVDLQRRMEQMKKSLEQQTKELDDRRRAFEKERDSWEDIHKQDEHNRETMDKKNKKKLLF